MHRPRRHRHYVLDERKQPRPATMLESALMTDGPGAQVALTDLGVWRVSTVFLGHDHAFGEGPPILFETMVFCDTGGLKEQGRRRYCTWAEAEVGHMEVVEGLREQEAQPQDADGERKWAPAGPGG